MNNILMPSLDDDGVLKFQTEGHVAFSTCLRTWAWNV